MPPTLAGGTKLAQDGDGKCPAWSSTPPHLGVPGGAEATTVNEPVPVIVPVPVTDCPNAEPATRNKMTAKVLRIDLLFLRKAKMAKPITPRVPPTAMTPVVDGAVTVTVNDEVPGVDGVPETIPVAGATVNPAGNPLSIA